MKQKIKSLPLTWHTAMHMGKGLQGLKEFLETTGVGSRTWILGPKKGLVGGYGWSHIRDEEKEEKGTRRREGEALKRRRQQALVKCFSFVILRIVWNFVSLTDDYFYTYRGECNFFY